MITFRNYSTIDKTSILTRKRQFSRLLIEKSIVDEINIIYKLQKMFSNFNFFVYFNFDRKLYIDFNVFKY